MDKTPDYWRWVYYITREWEYPDDVDASKIIGFAIILSTFGNKGHSITSGCAYRRSSRWHDRQDR